MIPKSFVPVSAVGCTTNIQLVESRVAGSQTRTLQSALLVQNVLGLGNYPPGPLHHGATVGRVVKNE